MSEFNFHFFKDFANWQMSNRKNSNLEWLAKDTFDSFQCGKKDNPEIKTYGVSDFTYKFNSHGFRSDEFINDNKSKILFAGCSFTEGIGLPIEHTWGYLTNQKLFNSSNFYNCARSGMSIESISRFLIIIIEHLKFRPNTVIFLLPSILRSETFYFDEINSEYSTFNFIDNQPALAFLKHKQNKNHLKTIEMMYNCNKNKSTIEFIKHAIVYLNLLKMTLDKYNIKLILGTWSKQLFDNKHILFNNIFNFEEQNFINTLFPRHTNKGVFGQQIARDYQHPGPNCHDDFSNFICENLKNQIKNI